MKTVNYSTNNWNKDIIHIHKYNACQYVVFTKKSDKKLLFCKTTSYMLNWLYNSLHRLNVFEYNTKTWIFHLTNIECFEQQNRVHLGKQRRKQKLPKTMHNRLWRKAPVSCSQDCTAFTMHTHLIFLSRYLTEILVISNDYQVYIYAYTYFVLRIRRLFILFLSLKK